MSPNISIFESPIEARDIDSHTSNRPKLLVDMKNINDQYKPKFLTDKFDESAYEDSRMKDFARLHNFGSTLSKINLTSMNTRTLNSIGFLNNNASTCSFNLRHSQTDFMCNEENEYCNKVNMIEKADRRKLYLEQIKLKNKILRDSDIVRKLDLLNDDDHEYLNEFKGAELFDNLEKIFKEREKNNEKEIREQKQDKGKVFIYYLNKIERLLS